MANLLYQAASLVARLQPHWKLQRHYQAESYLLEHPLQKHHYPQKFLSGQTSPIQMFQIILARLVLVQNVRCQWSYPVGQQQCKF